MKLSQSNIKSHLRKYTFLSAVMLSSATISQVAMAANKIYSPYVSQGELEIEYRGGYEIDKDNSKSGAWKQKFAVGYGITDYWHSEVYAVYKKSGTDGADPDLTALEWANRFQLTEQGEYWVDVGLYTELQYNTDNGADKAELFLLLAKDVNKFSHKANIKVEREFGDNSVDSTEFGVSWSSRYRYKPEFEPGFEVYSNFGSLSNGSSYSEEKHQIGPVAYGSIGAMKYDAGVLFGASNAAPDMELKLLLEYEWYF